MAQSKAERFYAIVHKVKAGVAKLQAKEVTGDWVTWEIQRLWAKANKRSFDKPEPEGAGGIGSTAISVPAEESPTLAETDGNNGRKPGTIAREDDQADDGETVVKFEP